MHSLSWWWAADSTTFQLTGRWSAKRHASWRQPPLARRPICRHPAAATIESTSTRVPAPLASGLRVAARVGRRRCRDHSLGSGGGGLDATGPLSPLMGQRGNAADAHRWRLRWQRVACAQAGSGGACEASAGLNFCARRARIQSAAPMRDQGSHFGESRVFSARKPPAGQRRPCRGPTEAATPVQHVLGAALGGFPRPRGRATHLQTRGTTASMACFEGLWRCPF